MRVEAAVGGQQPPPKRLFHELISRHGARVGAHQQLQDPQLCGGELHVLLAHLSAMRAQVETQRTPDDQAASPCCFTRHAAQNRANARDELARAERFGKIVISAYLETHDPVDFLSAGREHDDRHAAERADATQYFEPRELRQHHIQNHQIHARASQRLEPLGARRRGAGEEAFGPEVLREHGAELLIVIDDQQPRLRIAGGVAWLHPGNDTRMASGSGRDRLKIKNSLHCNRLIRLRRSPRGLDYRKSFPVGGGPRALSVACPASPPGRVCLPTAKPRTQTPRTI